MQITEVQVKKTAALAKLNLDEVEIKMIKSQLQELLDYAEILSGLTFENRENDVAPFDFKPTELQGPRLMQDEVLALSPDSNQGMIRVPRVLGDD